MFNANNQASKFAGFAAALLMAAGINGAVMVGFSQVATEGAKSSAQYSASQHVARVTLPTVTITASRA
jgi:hypothetical protein